MVSERKGRIIHKLAAHWQARLIFGEDEGVTPEGSGTLFLKVPDTFRLHPSAAASAKQWPLSRRPVLHQGATAQEVSFADFRCDHRKV